MAAPAVETIVKLPSVGPTKAVPPSAGVRITSAMAGDAVMAASSRNASLWVRNNVVSSAANPSLHSTAFESIGRLALTPPLHNACQIKQLFLSAY